jgi:rhodanese-related sulfurtransferase
MVIAIGRDEVQRLIEREAAQLVEVLPAAEFTREHLPGAISIPLKELGPPVRGNSIGAAR